MVKPRVLVFNRYYLPGFKAGGPVVSIRNIIGSLGNDIEFLVITTDRDLGDSEPYPNIEEKEWTTIDSTKVMYINSKKITMRFIAEIIAQTPHDAIYLNGYFALRTTMYPLVLRKLGVVKTKRVLLAPRGAFTIGALSLRHLEKKCYLFLARLFQLYTGVIWHASTSHEKEDIARTIGKYAQVYVAKDLPGSSQIGDLRERESHADLRLSLIHI